MSKPNILWQPNSDVQRAFLACSARTAMIGGGAASGKSSALLAASVRQIANPHHRAIIFRLDMPGLESLIEKSHALFLPMNGTFNAARHVWRWSSGATLRFAHLDDQRALYQHSGAEYSFVGIDEAQQLPGDDVDSKGQPVNRMFAFLLGRLRAPEGVNLDLHFRLAATPDGIGAGWLREYFKIPASGESCEHVDNTTKYRRAYFAATVRDNPAMDAESYERTMLGYSDARRRMLLLGDWSALQGAVFSEWQWALHTVPEFPIPAEWTITRCADDGYASPCACYWLAEDEIHGRTYVVAELYRRHLVPQEMASAVLGIDRSLQIDCGDAIVDNDLEIRGVIDSASFASAGMNGVSRADEMNRLGCKWTPCTKGPGSRVAGISAIHSALAIRRDGLPVFESFATAAQI